ncbi:MAG: putative manganese-dependent inorganic diphosphatase [Solobacterium sp.]|nr:putative manganese-dependent inorganic diphosphatase [Solobacterium sp.]
MKEIYVTGHRNPDTDAICSAISVAALEELQGREAIACRQGPLNEETKFVLKRFHQEHPFLLTDARLTLAEIELDEPVLLTKDATAHEAWRAMKHSQYRSLFVTENGQLCGAVTTSDLSVYRLENQEKRSELLAAATLDQIARTVKGTAVVAPEDFRTNGYVRVITLEEAEARKYDVKGGIAILSAGEDKQEMLISRGVRCLVITCGVTTTPQIRRKAAEAGCAIIETTQDTMFAAEFITESYPVAVIMATDIITFRDDEYVNDAAVKINKSRIRSFPVLDKNGTIIGIVSRYHVLNYEHRKVILTDHSAENQTLAHIEYADIQAIIDHHHIGGLRTDHPIYYRNELIGCTCTIVANMYKEKGFTPSADLAGIMLSAILSDTLNFKSATTRDKDRETAEWLAELAGILDMDAYAREMLGASVALKDATPHEILNRDLKSYQIGEYTFAIGQTNYSRMAQVQKILPEFRRNLKEEQERNQYDLLVMLFTDVMGEGSLFVYEGPLSYIFSNLLETVFDEHSGFDTKIISRKQQLMPMLSEAIKAL